MGKKTEVGEIEINVPASKLWKVFKDDSSVLLPKILPDEVSAIDILEGDGGVGTVRLIKFGPGVPQFPEQKEKVTEVDEQKSILAFEILEGGPKGVLFESLKVRIEVKEKGDSVSLVKQTVEYQPIGDQTPVPATDAVFRILKAIEAHLVASSSN